MVVSLHLNLKMWALHTSVAHKAIVMSEASVEIESQLSDLICKFQGKFNCKLSFAAQNVMLLKFSDSFLPQMETYFQSTLVEISKEYGEEFKMDMIEICNVINRLQFELKRK